MAADDQAVNEKLAALEKRFGKKPNIIYILTDDIGWGELGWQGGGKHRGTPTPTLNRLARQGMRFWSAYAEPSCTPSRIAINTGRHPGRTGLLSVLWPGQPEGLSPKEVTVAEILSDAGYHTAMWENGISGRRSMRLKIRGMTMPTTVCLAAPPTRGMIHARFTTNLRLSRPPLWISPVPNNMKR